jgi:hypothetical protein
LPDLAHLGQLLRLSARNALCFELPSGRVQLGLGGLKRHQAFFFSLTRNLVCNPARLAFGFELLLGILHPPARGLLGRRTPFGLHLALELLNLLGQRSHPCVLLGWRRDLNHRGGRGEGLRRRSQKCQLLFELGAPQIRLPLISVHQEGLPAAQRNVCAVRCLPAGWITPSFALRYLKRVVRRLDLLRVVKRCGLLQELLVSRARRRQGGR